MGPNGYNDIKSHPFFKGIDWSSLNETPPPSLGIIPRLMRKSSKASFGSSDNLNVNITPSSPVKAESPSSPFQVVSGSAFGSLPPNPAHVQWKRFLSKQEEIVYTALVIKRKKGVLVSSAKKRQLIMTNLPRFFYVDPNKMEIKGSIPWSDELKVIKKDEISFIISTVRSSGRFVIIILHFLLLAYT